jgi:hypothetical protein
LWRFGERGLRSLRQTRREAAPFAATDGKFKKTMFELGDCVLSLTVYGIFCPYEDAYRAAYNMCSYSRHCLQQAGGFTGNARTQAHHGERRQLRPRAGHILDSFLLRR